MHSMFTGAIIKRRSIITVEELSRDNPSCHSHWCSDYSPSGGEQINVAYWIHHRTHISVD